MSKLPSLKYSFTTFDKRRVRGAHGDDQFFVSRRARCYGIFDGVSGSNDKYGRGAAERVSNAMCVYSHQLAARSARRGRVIDPRKVLLEAHKRLTRLKDTEHGATTALLAALVPGKKRTAGHAMLKVANLGDCGVMVVRPRYRDGRSSSGGGSVSSAAASASSASSASSSCSSNSSRKSNKSTSSKTSSKASSGPVASSDAAAGELPAMVFNTVAGRFDTSMSHPHTLSPDTVDISKFITEHTVAVAEGDYVVLGTDGLFDNLTNQQIVEIVLAHGERGPDYVARVLGSAASNSHKLDDITIVVGVVTA